MRTITVYEHGTCRLDPVPSSDSLTPHEVKQLKAIWPKNVGPNVKVVNGCVRFSNSCGIVGLGSVQVEVLPKVFDHANDSANRGVLVGMLARVENKLTLLQGQSGSLSFQRHFLLTVFIVDFLDRLSCCLANGLPRTYQKKAVCSGFVRGRLDLRKQIRERNHGMVHSSQNHLCVDTAMNRLTKAALLVLEKTLTDDTLKRRCGMLLPAFARVADDLNARPTLPPSNRINQAWHPVWQLARLLVQLRGPEPHKGSACYYSMLFDMNVVFELFLRAELKVVLPKLGCVLGMGGKQFLAKERKWGVSVGEMKPDYRIEKNGRLVGLLDAKWKILKAAKPDPKSTAPAVYRPEREDLYQLYAYANFFDVKRLGMVVPKPKVAGGVLGCWTLGHQGIVFSTLELDLSLLQQGRDAFRQHLEARLSAWLV